MLSTQPCGPSLGQLQHCCGPAARHYCRVACRHAENRPDVPHRLAGHGGLPDDLWEHPVGHRGHPAVQHAGLVAGVPAAGDDPGLLPSSQVRLPTPKVVQIMVNAPKMEMVLRVQVTDCTECPHSSDRTSTPGGRLNSRNER